MNKSTHGYTLLEILVALAVFAILSTITTYSMYNAFTTRERVNVQANRLNGLQLGITLIARDIEQLVKPASLAPTSDFLGESNHVEFIRGGFVNPNNMDRRSTLQRIAYLCVGNQLIRRTWNVLNPTSKENFQDKALFNNLEKCQFAYLNNNRETLSTWAIATEQQENIKPEIVPRAIEFSLTFQQLGNMTLLFVVPGDFMNNSHRGSALLSALFIMTLVAIAATAMSTRLQLDIYRTHLTIASDELYLASQSVTFWAMDTLSQDSKKFMADNKGSKLQDFPLELQNDYPNVSTTGTLYDLQALFNLNSLQNPKFLPMGFRLLETVSKDADNRLILAAITHWINPYQAQNQQNKFLEFYANQRPPYQPSYHPMQSISELRLIDGISKKNYQALLPFVTVLPEPTPINIYTAPKAILAILGNGLKSEQIDEIIQARQQKSRQDLNQMMPLLRKLDIPAYQITAESSYFLSIAYTSSKDAHLTTYTIIKRSKNLHGVISMSIVNQSLNTL